MGGKCTCLEAKEEKVSEKFHDAESKMTADSAESVEVPKKKKDKKDEHKDDRHKKAAKRMSINKHGGGSKQKPSSLKQPQKPGAKPKAKRTTDGAGGGGSISRQMASSMACAANSHNSFASSAVDHRTTLKPLYTSTIKYHINSSRSNPLDGFLDDQLIPIGLAGRPLGRDQGLKKTAVGGAAITGDVIHKLTARRTVEALRKTPNLQPDIATILQEDFSALSCIVPGIYLTGTFGLQPETFAAAKIWLVVNSTNELPLVKIPNLITVRVPVEDDTGHRIDRYFDDVADLMETVRRRGYGSVVHCAAGVSRSAALTLAYLLKYTDLNLHEAFRHTRLLRPVIRPNMSFMKQLVDYESKLRDGHTSVRMVNTYDEHRRVSVFVPDFYQKEYPELFEREVVKQHQLKQAMAINCTSVASSSSAINSKVH